MSADLVAVEPDFDSGEEEGAEQTETESLEELM